MRRRCGGLLAVGGLLWLGASGCAPDLVGFNPLDPAHDFDEDGWISEEDLLKLLRPASVGVRAAAVIAAMDRNGDQKLDPDELRNALQKPSSD